MYFNLKNTKGAHTANVFIMPKPPCLTDKTWWFWFYGVTLQSSLCVSFFLMQNQCAWSCSAISFVAERKRSTSAGVLKTEKLARTVPVSSVPAD